MPFPNLVPCPATLILQNHILLTGFPFPHFHLQIVREENWRHKSRNHGLRPEQFKGNCKDIRKQTATVTILIIKVKKRGGDLNPRAATPPKPIPPSVTDVTSPLQMPVFLHWKRNTLSSQMWERGSLSTAPSNNVKCYGISLVSSPHPESSRLCSPHSWSGPKPVNTKSAGFLTYPLEKTTAKVHMKVHRVIKKNLFYVSLALTRNSVQSVDRNERLSVAVCGLCYKISL